MSVLNPAFSSCSYIFSLSHGSFGFSAKNTVEFPEAMIASCLSNLINNLSPVDFLPEALTSKCIPFANSYNIFLSDNLARSTL